MYWNKWMCCFGRIFLSTISSNYSLTFKCNKENGKDIVRFSTTSWEYKEPLRQIHIHSGCLAVMSIDEKTAYQLWSDNWFYAVWGQNREILDAKVLQPHATFQNMTLKWSFSNRTNLLSPHFRLQYVWRYIDKTKKYSCVILNSLMLYGNWNYISICIQTNYTWNDEHILYFMSVMETSSWMKGEM